MINHLDIAGLDYPVTNLCSVVNDVNGEWCHFSRPDTMARVNCPECLNHPDWGIHELAWTEIGV